MHLHRVAASIYGMFGTYVVAGAPVEVKIGEAILCPGEAITGEDSGVVPDLIIRRKKVIPEGKKSQDSLVPVRN